MKTNLSKQEITLFRKLTEKANDLSSLSSSESSNLADSEKRLLSLEEWKQLNQDYFDWVNTTDGNVNDFLKNWQVLEFLLAKFTKILYDLEIQEELKPLVLSPLSEEEIDENDETI